MKNFDEKRILLRINIKRIKTFMNVFCVVLFFLSIFYAAVWMMVNISPSLAEHEEIPLIAFANYCFPFAKTDGHSLLYTSIGVFVFFLLQIFSYIAIDKAENSQLKNLLKNEEKQKEKLKLIEKIQEKRKHDKIDNFSICFSVGLDKDEEIDFNLQKQLIIMFLGKIKIACEKYVKNIDINLLGEALIISSKYFYQYDNIYGTFLKILAYVKRSFEKKYEIKIIPNITVESFINNENINDIKNQHMQIQKLKFKNKALSCGTFNKKYNYIKGNKYAGIPIGEYMCGINDKNVDLSIVSKDLNALLKAI